MTNDPSDQHGREDRLNQVIAEYLESVHAGGTPDRRELVARQPELARELEAFFADHDKLNQIAAPLRAVVVPRSSARVTAADAV
jgi:hypothetical protein